MFPRFLLLAVSAFAVAACSSSAPDESAETEGRVSAPEGEMGASPSDACQATLVYLQKDAYKSTAGRTSEFWPPHTTTVLEVTCQTADGEKHIAPYQENYGTKPGQKDAQGNEILVKVKMAEKVTTVNAPWAKMQKLVESYESCGCDPTEFLSLDKVKAEGNALVAEILPLLTCADTPDAIVLALKEKRFDDAGKMVAKCRIKDGVTPQQIAATVAEIQSKVTQTFVSHHVCNNNAVLQADLFERFREKGDAASCEAYKTEFCSGPKLWFDPVKEVR